MVNFKRLSAFILCVTSIISITGCSQPNNNKSSSESLADSSESEKVLIPKHIETTIEGEYITLSFDGDVSVPSDCLNIYEGNLLSFSGKEAKEQFIEENFPEFASKSEQLQYVQSTEFGELFQYGSDIKASDYEKIQFLTDLNLLYYRTPDTTVKTDKTQALEDSKSFISSLGQPFSSNISDASFSNTAGARNCVSMIYPMYIDGIPSVTLSVNYGGDDSIYTGEWLIAYCDNKGVFNFQNSVLLTEHTLSESYTSDEWLHPEDVLNMLFEHFDTPEALTPRIKSIDLQYLAVPIRKVDPSKKRRIIPVWCVKYVDVSKTPSYIYVDAINGEFY